MGDRANDWQDVVARRIEQERLFPAGGPRPRPTLPEICLDVRSGLNGSADPWPDADLRAAYDLLLRAVASWDAGGQDAMDAAVLGMVVAAVDAVEAARPDWLPPADHARTALTHDAADDEELLRRIRSCDGKAFDCLILTWRKAQAVAAMIDRHAGEG